MNVQARYETIERQIRTACARIGRPRDSVTLLAVSKTKPVTDILQLVKLGQRAFGENYVQEAIEKITQLAESPDCPQLTWHFIGPIQSNKTRVIAEHFDWVHSIDRLKIAQRLSEQRPDTLGRLNVLVQVNTSGEASKSGVLPSDAVALCREIAALPNIKLRGLMTIPTATNDTQTLVDEFETCKRLLDDLQAQSINADTLSMGMSNDLELAIEHGSTCVRVGTALFGDRTRG